MLIDRASLLTALVGFHADLTRFRARLDQINTLPVPDHDTGTNLLATVSRILATASLDPAGDDLYDTFGNSGMLIAAWLAGGARVIEVSASIGQMAVEAAGKVEQTIVSPRPGLFLDYAVRSANLLARADQACAHNETAALADDLRLVLIETATEAAGLNQLVDSGSAGLYLLLKRLLCACPDDADDGLFEPRARDPHAAPGADDDIVEFLFSVEDASRSQILALLGRFDVGSVMLCRGLDGGIRVHCHGSGYLAADLRVSLAACSRVTSFRVLQVYGNVTQ